MDKLVLNQFNNQFLSALPRQDLAELEPFMKTVMLERGVVLYDEGDEIESAFFPLKGMISMVRETPEGDTIEVGTIGIDGIVGGAAAVGLSFAPIKAIVQIPATLVEIPIARMKAQAVKSEAVRELCIRYDQVQLIQARVSVACNVLHSIEHRFCRWLLQSAQLAGSEEISLTQEFMAEMLGVQRSSVSQVATKIQRQGHISYVRGQIKILDRNALQQCACDCYHAILQKSAVVWPGPSRES